METKTHYADSSGVSIAYQVHGEGPPDLVFVRELVVGSGLEFADRGVRALKGVPGEWRLFAVDSPPA